MAKRRRTNFLVHWVDDPKRVRMFTRVEGKQLIVRCLCDYSLSLLPSDDVETLRDRIAEALAGKPIGETAKILEEVVNS